MIDVTTMTEQELLDAAALGRAARDELNRRDVVSSAAFAKERADRITLNKYYYLSTSSGAIARVRAKAKESTGLVLVEFVELVKGDQRNIHVLKAKPFSTHPANLHERAEDVGQ